MSQYRYNPHTVKEALVAGSVGYALALINLVLLMFWGHDTGRLKDWAERYIKWVEQSKVTDQSNGLQSSTQTKSIALRIGS